MKESVCVQLFAFQKQKEEKQVRDGALHMTADNDNEGEK